MFMNNRREIIQKKEKICAIIVSFNSDKVFRCYQSVKEQVDFALIIDNGTSDETIISKLAGIANGNMAKRPATAKEAEVKVIFGKKNFGIAWALNQGVKHAQANNCDWVLTLDQDSQLPPSAVKDIMNGYGKLSDKEKENAGIVGCKYLERRFISDGAADVLKLGGFTADGKPFEERNELITSGNFVKLSVFEKTGLYEEKLFIDYVDVEFDYRVLKAGFKIYESQNVFVLHEFGKSEKKLRFHITNQPPFRRYYIARNCIYFFKKFIFTFPYKALRVLFGGTLGGAAKILLFEKEKLQKYKYILLGVKDALLNRYGKLNAKS
jgi:rhamnosyltransferase